MEYHNFLKKMGKNFDPFNHLHKKEIIEESKNFCVIPARSPYIEDHLLIVPKKSVNLLSELTEREQRELFLVLEDWTKKLHNKHKSVNLLLRDGYVWWESGKSINHLHFHLIPDIPIGSKDLLDENNDRYFFSDEEYQDLTKKLKIEFLEK